MCPWALQSPPWELVYLDLGFGIFTRVGGWALKRGRGGGFTPSHPATHQTREEGIRPTPSLLRGTTGWKGSPPFSPQRPANPYCPSH